jgi:hypothetical protein
MLRPSICAETRHKRTYQTLRARIALLYQRQYGVRQVKNQPSAEKAKHAAQRQIKVLTGARNLIVAINVLRGLNKAPSASPRSR